VITGINKKAMKKHIFLVFALAVLLGSCQKEEVKFDQSDDVLESLELKNDGDGSDEERCYYFLFPLSVDMPDGTVVSGDSREELNEVVKSWFKENGKHRKKDVSLHFPVGVNFKGKVIRLQNEKQLMRVRMACRGDKEGDRDRDKDKKACFKLVFPLTYKMPDGTLITRDSRKEIDNAIKRWYNANRSDKKPALQFPIQIKYETDRGEKIVDIENQRALKKAYEDCGK